MAWISRKRKVELERAALTAAVNIMPSPTEENSWNPRTNLIPSPVEWQREAWDFYDGLGMFRNAVEWKCSMLSRARLVAAVKPPDRREPIPLESGPAVDLVEGLAGGFSRQSELISNLTAYLTVPGEGYMVGEGPPEAEIWVARSQDQVRAKRSAMGGVPTYEVVSEDSSTGTNVVWRELGPNSMVVRVWRPHRRWFNVADSNARAARNTMRELELVNRHIASQYMSRLASAGVLLLPNEITFPVREEFQNAVDPFIAEWIETASEAIKTPGTAAGLVPIPIRVPGEYLDKIKLVDFTLQMDRQIITKRNSAVQQLAVDLDIPQEALLGMGQANHWSGWLIDEQGFKMYLAPDLELECAALTHGWLYPKLLASGESINTPQGQIVMWYDPSDLVLKPDRSDAAVLAYDRMELSGQSFRRETGFTEDDAPTKMDLADQALKQIIKQPANALTALKELTGIEVEIVGAPPTPSTNPDGANAPDDTTDGTPIPPADQKPREAPNDATPPSDKSKTAEDVQAFERQLVEQAQRLHAVRIDGLGGWTLLHPSFCQEHLFSCPLTATVDLDTMMVRPGTQGVYECFMNEFGNVIIGKMVPRLDTRDMIAADHRSPHPSQA